ncbi:MAG: carboxypeptidase regulatory-like domain-containing protein [Prevotellaceae bacterium]|jgi:tetratricopeptide (TPR) repeat protein|nr:carboxypeptidase regulatory-like domain-containing protein [Prevotellaceae bacterium]
MKKGYILICIFLCFSYGVFSQTKKDIKAARQMLSYYDYNGALSLLEKVVKSAKTIDPDAVDALAECYRKTGNLSKAENTYSWLLKLGNYNAEAHKYYAEVLMYFEEYAAAKEHFETYMKAGGNDPLVKRHITACDTAMSWMVKRDSSVFSVMNEFSLNTKYSEWGAVTMRDNRYLLYVSDYTVGKTDISLLRPFRTRKPVHRDEDGNAPRASRPPVVSPIYTLLDEGYNLGPVAYANNGRKMLYTRTSVTGETLNEEISILDRKLEIEEAVLGAGNKIIRKKSFEHNKPTEYSVGHPCLSPDEKTLYFVSDMPGGYGETDIYFCVLTAQGHWSEPVNAGPVINTEGKEMFPTMDSTGILYFSSNGHPGYGGLDIFRAKGERNQWVAIENLRAPINSGGDDFYLIFNRGMHDGYFASNRRGGMGSDDIYYFQLTGPLPDIGYIEAPNTFIQIVERDIPGSVSAEESNLPVEGVSLSLVEKKSNQVRYVTTDAGGRFVFNLHENTDYVLSFIKDGYIPVVNFEFKTGSRAEMQKLRLDLKMKPVEPVADEEIVINDNIILDLEQGTGVEYSVQILASKEYPNWDYLNLAQETYPQYKIYYGSFPDAFTRFTIGRFEHLKEANLLMKELRKIGYADAFVVMFVDGKRKVVAYH